MEYEYWRNLDLLIIEIILYASGYIIHLLTPLDGLDACTDPISILPAREIISYVISVFQKIVKTSSEKYVRESNRQ